MDRFTVEIPRRQSHSTSDSPLVQRITLPAPPFALEIDPERRDTAPRTAPIRNKRRGKFFGPIPDKRQFSAGVMDLEGAL